MKFLQRSDGIPILRTDFSDDGLWETVCTLIRDSILGSQSFVTFINDPEYSGFDQEDVRSLIRGSRHLEIFVVDLQTLSDPEHPLLVLGQLTEPDEAFRIVPAKVWDLASNLWVADMTYEDFAESADPDGVFRGFPAA